ncbi:MAG: hypothetical protein AAGM38_15190 [Pseudomonadota bacterium]
MDHNGFASIRRLFAKALQRIDIRRISTRLKAPKANAKAERFIQALPREGAMAALSGRLTAGPPTARAGWTGATNTAHTQPQCPVATFGTEVNWPPISIAHLAPNLSADGGVTGRKGERRS